MLVTLDRTGKLAADHSSLFSQQKQLVVLTLITGAAGGF